MRQGWIAATVNRFTLDAGRVPVIIIMRHQLLLCPV